MKKNGILKSKVKKMKIKNEMYVKNNLINVLKKDENGKNNEKNKENEIKFFFWKLEVV
jgi:hypothetical protein